MRSRPEPEWDDLQRAFVHALADLKADECPGCGGYLSETSAKENMHAYHVPPPRRCHRCTALEAATSPKTNGDVRTDYTKSPQPRSLRFSVERKG